MLPLMRPSRIALSAVLICSAAVLTGCSPGHSGVIGISVDEAGRPVVVLQDCKGEIDKLVLSALSVTNGVKNTEVARWRNPKSPKGIVEFPLVEGAGRWKSEAPVPALDVRRRYELNGWQKNDATRATPVAFTPAMLKDLQPGQILRWRIVSGDPYATETVTREQFTPPDCG